MLKLITLEKECKHNYSLDKNCGFTFLHFILCTYICDCSFLGWEQFFQSFCISTHACVISLVASPLVLLQRAFQHDHSVIWRVFWFAKLFNDGGLTTIAIWEWVMFYLCFIKVFLVLSNHIISYSAHYSFLVQLLSKNPKFLSSVRISFYLKSKQTKIFFF